MVKMSLDPFLTASKVLIQVFTQHGTDEYYNFTGLRGLGVRGYREMLLLPQDY